MENFSLATFDFTAPASWVALGEMWQVTHGYLPSHEQLLGFVISQQQPQQQQPQQQWAGGQSWGAMPTAPPPHRGARGRGGFPRGRGYYGGGNARDGQPRWQSDMGETDAIVLGGGDEDVMMVGESGPPETGGGPGGRMQKVGEKWLFTRDT